MTATQSIRFENRKELKVDIYPYNCRSLPRFFQPLSPLPLQCLLCSSYLYICTILPKVLRYFWPYILIWGGSGDVGGVAWRGVGEWHRTCNHLHTGWMQRPGVGLGEGGSGKRKMRPSSALSGTKKKRKKEDPPMTNVHICMYFQPPAPLLPLPLYHYFQCRPKKKSFIKLCRGNNKSNLGFLFLLAIQYTNDGIHPPSWNNIYYICMRINFQLTKPPLLN